MHSPGECIHDLYTSLKSTDGGYLSAADSTGRPMSLYSFTSKTPEKLLWSKCTTYITVVQRYSRSSKLVQVESPYATSY